MWNFSSCSEVRRWLSRILMNSVCVPGGQIRRQNARHPRGGERHIRHDACRDVFFEETELVKYLERGNVDLRGRGF
jgi:hypothetical protein